MKVKNLEKKIGRLRARIAKDTRKLGKLQGKLAAAHAKKSAKTKTKAKAKSKAQKPAKSAKAGAASRKKKKRHLSPEARAKLAERMKQRWAAKRAAEQSTAMPAAPEQTVSSGPPAV